MAANRNHPSPWMAFVPFARTYLRGELSGDIYLKKRSVKNPGLLLVLMPIAYSVIVSCLLLVCFMFAIFGASVMINGGVETVVSVLLFGFAIPVLVISIVYQAVMSVLNVLVDYQIYSRYMPLHLAVIHAVLGIFVPLYRGIYLFYIRKTPCYGMGQQRTDRQERAQTVVKDAVQKEAQANADVRTGNTQESFRRAVCRKNAGRLLVTKALERKKSNWKRIQVLRQSMIPLWIVFHMKSGQNICQGCWPSMK
ncbi:MAG: hypothetical protein ACLSIF_08255 [Faecalimonas umbilicata]